jgi:hypothetical protein
MAIHYNTHDDYLFATSLDLLQGMGVSITSGTDFEEYRQLLAEARPDHALGEPFEPVRYKLTKDNACWLVGRNANGENIHTQAMKKLDLPHMRLGDYLQANLREFEPSGMDIDYGRTVYRAGPGARRMSGQIVYHGEFWVGGNPKHGMVLSPLLGRHAFLTSLMLWQPDYTFGFIAKRLAFKGFSTRFGFMHTDPSAIKYVLKGTGEVFEGIMGYMTREDLHYVLDIPVEDMIDQAA